MWRYLFHAFPTPPRFLSESRNNYVPTQGRPKGTPGDPKCVTEIIWGQKYEYLGGGIYIFVSRNIILDVYV